MNDQDLNRVAGCDLCGPDGDDDRSGVSVRPVRPEDGRGIDAAPAYTSRPVNRADSARMLSVRSHGKTGRKRGSRGGSDGSRLIARRGPGYVYEFNGKEGVRFWAALRKNGHQFWVGSFDSVSLAEQAIDAMLETIPEAVSEIVEAYVAELVDAVPLHVRHAYFGASWDPIAESVCRMRFALTLEQVGRLYGVSRQRIEQIESRSLRKMRKPMRDFEGMGERSAHMWDVIESMGGDS